LNNISDRLRTLERQIGPSDKHLRELEEISKRLIDVVNNIDPEHEGFAELLKAVRAVLPGRRR
jgi:hypothetical protein